MDFGLILVKYGLERILFRLSSSRHRDVFILKGALLFELWTEQRYRPTRDADFLAHGDNTPERFAHIFRELCVLEVDQNGGWILEQLGARSVVFRAFGQKRALAPIFPGSYAHLSLKHTT